MTDQIASRDHIKAMARDAFAAKRGRDSHQMNWHSPALATWLEEFDRLAAASKASHKSHAAPAGRKQFDRRQLEAV
jgi:hypothetical protein